MRHGWSEDDARQFIEDIATSAGDSETADTVKSAEYTGARLKSDKTATGWPTVEKLTSKAVVDKVLEWLGIGRAEEAKDAPPAPSNTGLMRLSDVAPERVSWLWPGRIPLGKLILLDGDPGLGKSTITMDLAARVSTGRAMPDGSIGDVKGPAGVLILSAEDGLADTIRPRLDLAGADCDRVGARQTIVEASGLMRMPSLADLSQIKMDIAVLDARLVIIDPVMAYLPEGVKSHVDADVRRLLAPLAELAEKTGVAILVLRHLNKMQGGNPLYRGGGSIAFIGAVRAGLLVAKDPDDDTDYRFVLATLKSNLAKKAPALAYHIEGDDEGASYIVWDGPSKYGADELLSSTDSDERGALADAVAFLKDFLQDGPCRANKVLTAARAAGVTERTLRRAKDRLRVKVERIGAITDGHWEWRLPDDRA
jgi:hypothetical protein